MYKTYFGLLSLPIAAVGFLVAVIYFVVVARAMWYRRVSRKCYLLLLDRTIGDLLASLTALTCAIYIVSTKNFEYSDIFFPKNCLP